MRDEFNKENKKSGKKSKNKSIKKMKKYSWFNGIYFFIIKN